MTLKIFFLIAGIVAGLFGLGFLLFPDEVMRLYGVSLDAHFQYFCLYYGSALIGLAVIWIAARNAKSFDAVVRAILLGGLVASALGFAVSLWNALAGISSSFIWINPLIFAVLSIGFAYFYIAKRSVLKTAST